MRKIYNLILLFLFTIILTNVVIAQNNFFTNVGKNVTLQTSGQREIFPQKFNGFSMDVQGIKSFLWSLPAEKSIAADRGNAPVMEIPMPDGSTAKFKVWESSIMEPGLAAKFPEMRTFAGQGIDDPYATIRFDYNPYTGFHGQILSAAKGRVYIDPFARGDLGYYMSYNTKEYTRDVQFICETVDNGLQANSTNITNAVCLGANLRTYRLALACTGEYAVAVAGPTPTVPAVAAAMLVAVNRVTGVYEVEVSLRMTLIANNDLLIYLNGATDPYTNNSGGTMLGENQTNINAVIGSANYDIGHVFSTGGGGIASLNSPCTGNKARGVTGLPNPVGDPFYIDYVAHEMGHQWGGNHSMAGCGSSPNSTKYEVGSGNTIQAYAGICGAENIQPNSDPYFHPISFDEISNFITTGSGSTCGVSTPTGNTLPVIDPLPNNGVTIPISTPFTLSGTATDANGDPLTYSWEQWDLGGGSFYTWNAGATAAANNTVPLFKSRIPKITGERTFPDIAVILANYPANPAPTLGGLKGETLSPVARNMNFRLTVRDNRAGGGGVSSSGGGGCQSSTAFTVAVAGTTPFAVTSPNGGENYPGGSSQTITWNNAGTNAAPFNVANVRITLSTDGGLTYPTVISASTPNDGTESLVIPAITTTTARIKIEAIGNIFFDISNANFTISIPTNGFTFNSPVAVTATCPAPNVMTSSNLTATFTGTFNNPASVINLTGVVAPAGPIVSFSNPVLTVASPSSTVSLTGMAGLSPGTYTVTVTGTGVGTGAVNQTRDIAFTINPGSGPTITGQPSSVAVCPGDNASFNVTATGTYQWQVSTAAVPTFTNIGGATTATLNLTGVTTGMNGNQYRCVVTGQCGSSNSTAATLTVNTVPAISGEPSAIAVCSGSSASFIVTASGTAITYQWQVSTTAVPTFTNIGGANSATYTIPATTVSENGNQYRCVVSGTCTPAAISLAATLTVNSSVTVTSNPTDKTICEATGTTFTANASGSGLNYQWEVSTNGTTWTSVTNNANYSGATTPTLTLTNTPPTFNNNLYRCNITSPPCTPGITTVAKLTVNTFPVIITSPSNVTICEGGNPTLSVVATTAVGSLTYQWQVSTNGGTSWTNVIGATSSTFSQTNVPIGQNGYLFRVVVTAGCGSSNSASAMVTVNAFPVASLTNIPTTLCLSDPAYMLTASVGGGTWNGPGVTGSSFSPSAAGLGTKSINYVLTNAGCVTTKTSVIQVNECAERHRRLYEFDVVKAYPVPNDGRFSIRLLSDLYQTMGVRIFNSVGQEVHNKQFSGLTYGSVVSLDISGIAKGVYQVFMYSSDLGDVDTKTQSIIIGR